MFLNLDTAKLPTEYPFKDAIFIYLKRLKKYFIVLSVSLAFGVSLLFFPTIFLIFIISIIVVLGILIVLLYFSKFGSLDNESEFVIILVTTLVTAIVTAISFITNLSRKQKENIGNNSTIRDSTILNNKADR